ncbi:hypothetical protein OPQ81_000931 [Rhizoctonia solani]|nr:hypothetical protein OPQ81_000931 [Rhizoctonia solani]
MAPALVRAVVRGTIALVMGTGTLARAVHTMTRRRVSESRIARLSNVDTSLAGVTLMAPLQPARPLAEWAITRKLDRLLVLFALLVCIATLKQPVTPSFATLAPTLILLGAAKDVRTVPLVHSTTATGILRAAIAVLDGSAKETVLTLTANGAQILRRSNPSA